MVNDRKTLGVIAGFVVLAGLAIAGWARHAPEVAPVNANAMVPDTQQNSASPTYPATFVSNHTNSPESSYANNYAGSYQQDGYYSSIHRPVYVHRNSPPETVVERQRSEETVYTDRGTRRVYRTELHHGRSTKKSVAIVAGTAGAGAAIGALAGGGKGAAIGALSGGGAGFLYDRLTHNH